MDPTEAVSQAVGRGPTFSTTTSAIVTQMSSIVSTIAANPLLIGMNSVNETPLHPAS